MKTSITLTALSLLLSTAVFAKAPAQFHRRDMKAVEQVSLIPLQKTSGLAVRVDKEMAGKSLVIIYDNDKNVIFKDVLTKGMVAEKKYILTNLAAGNYTVEVFSKTRDIKTKFYVYNKGDKKVIFVV